MASALRLRLAAAATTAAAAAAATARLHNLNGLQQLFSAIAGGSFQLPSCHRHPTAPNCRNPLALRTHPGQKGHWRVESRGQEVDRLTGPLG